MNRLLRLSAAALAASGIGAALALNPPHNSSNAIECLTCHTPHGSGSTSALLNADTNPNLCLTCHVPAGIASGRPFSDADQAFPGVSGTSHRWDSGPSGHVKRGSPNTSPGTIRSSGTFTGRIEDTYTITISTAGEAGVARFNWTSTYDGSGTAVFSGSGVAIGTKGLLLTFTNGSPAPSFKLNDQWKLYVRTDLRLPAGASGTPEGEMAIRLANGKVVCSTCHDQHNHSKDPWDPFGPGVGFDPPPRPVNNDANTGAGRKYQRIHNNDAQMCVTCHSSRNVTSAAQGSHAIGIPIPGADTRFKSPAALPLDSANRLQCLTCHAPHYATSGGVNAGTGDGYLLRTGMGVICLNCHTNTTNGDPTPFADTAGGSHFSATTGALWGGTDNGSSFPAHSADKRGMCINCHWPHGWPDDATPANDYPRLWVDRYDQSRTGKTDPDDAEDLCYGCHTNAGTVSPATSNIEAEFAKGSALATATGPVFRHPVRDSEQAPLPAGRAVECVDCHDPHKATAANRLAGVSGVNLAGTAVTLGGGTDDAEQAFLCYKCHGDTFNAGRNNTSNKRLDFNTTAANSGYHPVSQAGRGQSANLAAQLLGGLTTSSTIRCTDCHNTNAASNSGPVNDTTALTYGPHGSTIAYILRAGFSTNYTATGWNNANAGLCFLCHSQTALLSRDRGGGARTNFYGAGKDNLHWFHLTDKGTTASCMSCHYDIHSNRTASNTQYCVGTSISNCSVSLTNSPPSNVKTHLVNFAPDVQALSYARPRWSINTSTGVRGCDLACHGSGNKMQDISYGPTTGDETSHTY